MLLIYIYCYIIYSLGIFHLYNPHLNINIANQLVLLFLFFLAGFILIGLIIYGSSKTTQPAVYAVTELSVSLVMVLTGAIFFLLDFLGIGKRNREITTG